MKTTEKARTPLAGRARKAAISGLSMFAPIEINRAIAMQDLPFDSIEKKSSKLMKRPFMDHVSTVCVQIARAAQTETSHDGKAIS